MDGPRDNALTGTNNGKQAVSGLWGEFGSKDFRTEPHDFIADGDKVVVLTTIHLDGETVEAPTSSPTTAAASS